MVDVACLVGATPCLNAADDAGYEIDENEVVYWGRCPDCVTATSVLSGEPNKQVKSGELSDGSIEEEKHRRA